MNSRVLIVGVLASATLASCATQRLSGSYGGRDEVADAYDVVSESVLSPVMAEVLERPKWTEVGDFPSMVISEVDGRIVLDGVDLGVLVASGNEFVEVDQLRCASGAGRLVDENAIDKFVARGGNDPASERLPYLLAAFDEQRLCWEEVSELEIEGDGSTDAWDWVEVPHSDGQIEVRKVQLAVDSLGVAWTVASGQLQRRDPRWRQVSEFDGVTVRAVIPGVAAASDRTVWTFDGDEWKELACFEAGAGAAVDLVETSNGFVAASMKGVWKVENGECERIGPGLSPDFALAMTDDVLWVAAADGVSRLSLDGGPAAAELGCDRPLTGTMRDVWVVDVGRVGVAWPRGSAVLSVNSCAVEREPNFPGGGGRSPVQGIQAGERTILASGGGPDKACLAIRGTDSCIDGLEIEGVTALESFALDPEKMWVGTVEGLFAADIDSERPIRVDLRDSFGPTEVHDIEVGDDGSVWIAHDAGLTLHWPSSLRPSFAAVQVKTDGRVCPECGDATGIAVPYGTNRMTVNVRGFGYDPAMAYDIDIDGAKLVLDPSVEAHTFELEPGRTYVIKAAIIDGSLNRTEIEIPIRQERESIGSRLSGFFTNALTYVFAALLVGLAALAFVAWRRLGRVRLVDATWIVRLTDGKPASELSIARPFMDRLRPSKLTVFESMTDFDPQHFVFGDGSNVDSSALDVGRGLLASFGGTVISSQLRRSISKPTTSGVRLNIEIAEADVEQLRAIPWELIADERGQFTEDGLAPVRHVADVESVSRTGPLKILVVRTHPADSEVSLNDFDRQRQAIEAAFPAEVASGSITVYDDVDIEDFEQAISTTDWDIIHIYGHGNTDEAGGFVRFASNREGSPPIYADDIVGTFAGTPLLVTVAACRTSNPSGVAEDVPGFGEALVTRGAANHAIGFAYEIAQVGVADFVVGFYSQLGQHRQVDVAMRAGRAAMTTGVDDQAAVRLYGGTPGGMLYEKR